MSYSAFISYRRNLGDDKFIKKFKAIIECEASKVTNIEKVFFDEDYIKWGDHFDDKIYNSIVDCYFFIPFYHNAYLHEDNLWCAKELYRAIEVEKKIRDSVDGYCFILPIIDRGSADAFPDCIGRKHAKEIKKYRHLVVNNRTSEAFEAFKGEMYDVFLKNYILLNNGIDFVKMCVDIVIPSDEEIISWIKGQKDIEKKSEAKHLPILRKNDLE
ncbi:MAG: hypothetical protein WCK32_06205 [Chlorobiaceae bacterium]